MTQRHFDTSHAVVFTALELNLKASQPDIGLLIKQIILPPASQHVSVRKLATIIRTTA
jgi:hypothetical protein